MATIELPEIHCRSLYKEKLAPHRWQILEDVQVTLSNGDLLFIPKGYITDFATVPRLCWGIVATIGNHNLATLIHDYLLTDSSYDRSFIDNEMLYWLKLSGVRRFKGILMYYAVRANSYKQSIKQATQRLSL